MAAHPNGRPSEWPPIRMAAQDFTIRAPVGRDGAHSGLDVHLLQVDSATDYRFDHFRRQQLTDELQFGAACDLARGLARLDDVVWEAGPSALHDLRSEAPLVHAAAEAAWIWRALTPLGRVTMMAVGALAAAAVYGGVKVLGRRMRAS